LKTVKIIAVVLVVGGLIYLAVAYQDYIKEILIGLGLLGGAGLEAKRRSNKNKIKKNNEEMEEKLNEVDNDDSLSDRINKHNRGG